MTTKPTRPTMTALGANTRARREEVGWTQAELARAAGLAPSTISAIEYGERMNDPGISVVYRIALVLGVTIEDLIGVQPLHRTTKAWVVRQRNKTTQIG